MKSEIKNRRSKRIPARHNIMLAVEGKDDSGKATEVVTTMLISRHGAQLIGRRPMDENTKGKVTHLSTCRQAPFRIVWQTPSSTKPGYHETGIEFEESTDFWGTNFEEMRIQNSMDTAARPAAGTAVEKTIDQPVEQAAESAAAASRDGASSSEVLEQLRTIPSSSDGREITDAIWCGLIEHLEERRVISRTELIASLRKVGLQL